jgi:hypothetical protein
VKKRYVTIIAVVVLLLLAKLFWSEMINLMMPSDSRPGKIHFTHEVVSDQRFDEIENELKEEFGDTFFHAELFRKHGINSYEGPSTCLKCHETLSYTHHKTGETKSVDLMENLTRSAHYRFFTKEHDNVWGFNGELADNFPMGKINRPCPKPGSFAMTAWAELVVTQEGDTLSEGCGQCHIGGQYQAPLGEMMPFYSTTQDEKDAIDCLICHSVAYDMNQKQVIEDPNGLKRWKQDRSMKSAVSVTRPTSQSCLRCHQHNFGGDIYVDNDNPSFMQSLLNTGKERPRVLHPGSKRGTPITPTWDVHAAAGMDCIDCHTTHGHYIAKGQHTTTMMANDLPDVEVSCTKCHTDEPHNFEDEDLAYFYNDHAEFIACQTCHIPSLHEDNVTMRDFGESEYEDHEGIYIYHDKVKKNQPGEGIAYTWWNGDATFLGNPIGENRSKNGLFKFYNPDHKWPEYENYNYDKWYEDVMRPIAQKKPSKLYAMKRFNGRQHIDLANMGPFGGMFVPYNLPAYYKDGDTDKAASTEMDKSMMKMMYGYMFKFYMLDKFIGFMDDGSGDQISGWNTGSYQDVKDMKNVSPRWIPSDAMLEISHSIRKNGALTCVRCHSKDSVLDWEYLGYTTDEIEELSQNPLE